MSSIYGCVEKDNDCEKKDTCYRVLDDNDGVETTLFKYACTKDNKYQLYIPIKENKEEPTE